VCIFLLKQSLDLFETKNLNTLIIQYLATLGIQIVRFFLQRQMRFLCIKRNQFITNKYFTCLYLVLSSLEQSAALNSKLAEVCTAKYQMTTVLFAINAFQCSNFTFWLLLTFHKKWANHSSIKGDLGTNGNYVLVTNWFFKKAYILVSLFTHHYPSS
jgi:uncharacterized membrane protein